MCRSALSLFAFSLSGVTYVCWLALAFALWVFASSLSDFALLASLSHCVSNARILPSARRTRFLQVIPFFTSPLALLRAQSASFLAVSPGLFAPGAYNGIDSGSTLTIHLHSHLPCPLRQASHRARRQTRRWLQEWRRRRVPGLAQTAPAA
jgi:hypothetical protein